MINQLILDVINPYLLIDTFSDPKTAGNINGSPSLSGHKRTVTDGNSKLTIANNLLTFAAAGVGAGNPGLWYPRLSRDRGLGVVAIVTPSDTVSAMNLGFDGSAAGQIFDAIGLSNVGTLKVLANNVSIASNLLFTGGTSYKLCVILRDTGAFFFIKGGIYTDWTLVWTSSLGSAAVFPGVGSSSSTTTAYTVQNFRVFHLINDVIRPAASDSFTRSNGAIGSTDGLAHIEGIGGSILVWTGSTWTILSNAAINTPTLGSDDVVNGALSADTDWSKGAGWTISGGKGVAASATGNLANTSEADSVVGTWYQSTFDVSTYTSGTLRELIDGTAIFSPDVTAIGSYLRTGRATAAGKTTLKGQVSLTATVDNPTRKALTLSTLFASIAAGQTNDIHILTDVTLVSGTQAGLVMNLDSESSPANFIIAYHDGTNVHLDKCVAGVYTSLISAVATYSAGATLRVMKFGTSYVVWYNNALVGSLQTVSDAGIISNTKHGLFSTYSGNSLDNFLVYPVGISHEYAQLDTF